MSNRKKGDQAVEPKAEVRASNEPPEPEPPPESPDAELPAALSTEPKRTPSELYIARLLNGAPKAAGEERRADEWARLYGHVNVAPTRNRPRVGLSEQRAFIFNTAMSHSKWGVMREGQLVLTNTKPITQKQYEDAIRGGFGVTQKGH